MVQLRVLVFQSLEPPRPRYFHAAAFRPPGVERGIADPVLAAQIGHRSTRLMLFQDSDDLALRET